MCLSYDIFYLRLITGNLVNIPQQFQNIKFTRRKMYAVHFQFLPQLQTVLNEVLF